MDMITIRKKLEFKELKGIYETNEENLNHSLQSSQKNVESIEAVDDKNEDFKVIPPPSFLYSSSVRKPTKKALEDNKEIKYSEYNNEFSDTVQTDSCCVTVFGYSLEDHKNILKELEELGNIVEHIKKGKNWMNVKYKSISQARNALLLNGTLINGNIIGVKKCNTFDFNKLEKNSRKNNESEKSS